MLENKIAVVTGAGRGIGKAIAEAYAAAGAKVVCAARSTGEIEPLAAKLGGLAITCDVSQESEIQNLMRQTLDAFGQIDILVNNAGAVARLPVHELPVEDWDYVMNVNLRAVFLCCKYAIPSMLAKGSGYIIKHLFRRWCCRTTKPVGLRLIQAWGDGLNQGAACGVFT